MKVKISSSLVDAKTTHISVAREESKRRRNYIGLIQNTHMEPNPSHLKFIKNVQFYSLVVNAVVHRKNSIHAHTNHMLIANKNQKCTNTNKTSNRQHTQRVLKTLTYYILLRSLSFIYVMQHSTLIFAKHTLTQINIKL